MNLNENRNLIMQLLEELPNLFSESHSTESALGAALQAAFKMSSPTGELLIPLVLFSVKVTRSSYSQISLKEVAAWKVINDIL